ncbi:protein naked cuticle homolog 1 [Lates japonicus]|uniref:Protein naked cuticle homolog n=1 Tax=Lates japonicus TaxID=270547 RepID=A0AAD3R7W5_LATJO|nr:protein naked cuticle homolog 1 [Lates japonicus]
MGKLHSKHAAICKPRESPEGDSFVVNACLARKGIDDWLVKQKYYCTSSRLEQQDCHHKNNCGLTTRDSMDEACAEGIGDEHYRLEGTGVVLLVPSAPHPLSSDNADEGNFTFPSRLTSASSTLPTSSFQSASIPMFFL